MSFMNNELERTQKKGGAAIHFEGLNKTKKNLSQDSQCPREDTNWAPRNNTN
jgi:hypothetical protein